MRNMTGKRAIAALTAIIMLVATLTGFTYYNGIGTVYFDSHLRIFNGVTYREQIAYNNDIGIQHAYIVEADLTQSNLKPLVFNGEVRGTYTIGSMIQYAKEQGYHTVAGINGDIYDTSSGTPKGTVIHDGLIVTSGYQPERVITFDAQGRAAMKYVTVSYGMKGTIGYVYEEEQMQEEIERKVDFFNVPYGAAKGLHLYNRHYSSSTRTSGSCIEVVIECGEKDNIQLKVNNTIKGVVKSVNPNTSNTPIGETEIILSTVNGSESAGYLAALIPGSEIEITVTDTSGYQFEDVKEAIGLYYSLVENGSIVTTGDNINPRTALGIKADGSIVLYVLDGRQPAISRGLSLVDVAKHMIDLGCVDAYNLDGGGSSVMYARAPGIDEIASLKNSPSEATQRRVSNGILLTYTDSAGSFADQLNVYPAKTLVMPGADVQVETYASNELYEKASVPRNINYSVDPLQGEISGSGLFTAAEDADAGIVEIEATSENLSGRTEVEIIKDIYFAASVNQLFIDQNKEVDIDVIVKSGIADVSSKDSLFTWNCDPNIGTIDQEGRFISGQAGAQTGNITIEYGNQKVTVPVQVGALTIDFNDTENHWAREYIGKLAARGVLNGMGGNLFVPDGQLTRAQFLAMLAKSQFGLDVTESEPAPFTDVTPNEWYYDYVSWGFESGIVNGMSETIFSPNANITREQMAVMLCNYARYLDYEIPQEELEMSFIDQEKISLWAVEPVKTVVMGGIMNGQPEGDFQPQGNATRAQAAKVVYVFCNLKDGIEN